MLSDLVFWHESWTLFTSDWCIRRKNNSNSETYLLIFLSVIEDILVLLITGLSYLFTTFLSRYSTLFVFLFGCFSCISTFSPWEISSLFIECVSNPLYNQVCLDKLVTILGAVYMRWDISPRWDVSPEWDTFHSAFIWEKYPTWVSHLSSQLVCMPIFKYLCCFHYLLILFLFQLRITNKIFGYKFYEMNCNFLPNNYQNKPSLN